MKPLRALWNALFTRRTMSAISRLESRLSFFTPSDWLVVSVLAIVMALAAGVLLAGVSVALTNETPARGGTYTEGIVGTPRFINPLIAISDTDRDLVALVYSGLMKENPDGSLSPDLAASYEISADKLTYTFTLKDGARFQDGTTVTADDIAYTIREAQNPDIKSPVRANWEGVAVEVVDPKTVSFTLKSPYAPFLEDTTLGILPKHLWQEVTAEQFPFSTLNQSPVGSGPYAVSSVLRNTAGIPTEYRLTAFDGGVRTPYISNFVMKFYTDQNALQTALNQGAVEAAYGVVPSGVIAADSIHEAIYDRIFGVFFNQSQNQIFSDAAVRKALDTAVDKKSIVSTVLKGYGSVIDGPLPPDSIGTSGETSPEDRRGTAREILANAGWKPGTDGILEKTVTVNKKKTTERLSFTLATSNVDELKGVASMVSDDWRALGAEVTTQFFDQTDLARDVIKPRRYDALLFGLVVGRSSDLYPFWHSSQKNDPGLNIALYANANVDKLLEAARTTTENVARHAKAVEAAKVISSETAALFLYTPHFVYLAPRNAQGIVLDSVETPSDRFASVDEWYLSTERVWPIFAPKIPSN